ncbi:MAG: hypothetical protein K9L82_02580 [Chromatiaceae bacterium]|nr:hypothetical protein [Chromatiaceae bacterium]MCF8017566.1 hypothetical protein [Chromatiaceae bacterium]
MGKILDDMTHLRGDIDRAREVRAQAQQGRSEQLADRASMVERMLTGFAATRANQGAADRTSRQQFLAGLEQDINALNQGVRDRMQTLHQTRVEQVAAAAGERRAQVEAIADDIRGTLGDFKQKMSAFRSDYLASVNEDAFARAGFVANTGRQVAEMVGGFRRERSEQAAADAQARLAFIRDLGSQVAAIQSSVAEDLDGVRQLFGSGNFSGPIARRPAAPSKPSKPTAMHAQAQPQPAAKESKPTAMHAQAQPQPAAKESKPSAAERDTKKPNAQQAAKAKEPKTGD